MKILVILFVIIIILQAFRVSINYLRKDEKLTKKIFETFILISTLIICFFNFEYDFSGLQLYLSIVFSIYIIIMYIYEKLTKDTYISVLSVKKAIDMSDMGIMFLDEKQSIILTNNKMKVILDDLNIKKDYVNILIKKSFKTMEDSYLLKHNNLIYQLKIIDNREITLIDITEIYKLQEQEELQNKLIEENNKKIIETINNIEKIEKTKNLLKIKNQYHDIIGHRLALFTKYLEQNKNNLVDIEFLLNSIYDDFDYVTSKQKLDNLVKMYNIIGINITLKGTLPEDDEASNVFFEIIREAVTNAIIHANSKNINVTITQYLDRLEMIITNDGNKPKETICENEGIKGMRRKLLNINGNLTILTVSNFTLKVTL